MKLSKLYYIGVVVEVIDPTTYEILVDIPGLNEGLKAHPTRGELDEPRVGDNVLLKCLDPVFSSYFLYQKIKENDFIGVRSNGKMIDITEDHIQISTFDPNTEYNDRPDSEIRPEPLDYVKLDSEGNLEVSLRKNANLTVEGDVNLTVTGTVTLTGNVEVKGGTYKMAGTVAPKTTGPFNCIPTCPFSGVPHAGDTVTNP